MILSNRQRKAADKATRARKAAPKTDTPARSPRKLPDEIKTGLQWLEHKKAISRPQRISGERYGAWYRGAIMSGGDALRSCLDDSPRGSGSRSLPSSDASAAQWIIECRESLSAARSTLNNHAGMVAACDLICGRGLKPTEIFPGQQRPREELVTALRIALDMIADLR